MLLTQKQKIFQQTKSYKLQIITITFFYSFWNSFWYVSFIFSVLFLLNIQMCSLCQAYYWMPDFSPSFLLSGLIEFSVPLPSDHPIYILLFFDIVTITNFFFIIHIHHEELHLYISRNLRILSLYSSAWIVPEDELIKVILENDELKNPAIHLENKRKIHSLVTIKTPV